MINFIILNWEWIVGTGIAFGGLFLFCEFYYAPEADENEYIIKGE